MIAGSATAEGPVSALQRAMLYDEALWPGSSAGGYFAVRLAREFPRTAIEDAFRCVLAAIPALNVKLNGSIEAPVWVPVTDQPQVEVLPLERLDAGDKEKWKSKLRIWCKEHWSTPDPWQERPVRLVIFASPGQPSIAAFSVHHLAFDGRSKFHFAELFERALSGQDLEPQRTQAPEAKQATEIIEGYWTESRLVRLQKIVQSPNAFRSSAKLSSTETILLENSVSKAFVQACQNAGATPFEGALGILQHVCLHAYDHAPVVLVPVDLRRRATRRHIGLFAHNVPILFDSDEVIDFASLVQMAKGHKRHLFRAPFNEIGNLIQTFEPRQRGSLLTGPTFRQLTFAFVSDRGNLSVNSLEPQPEWDMFIPNRGQSTATAVHVRHFGERLLLRVDFDGVLVSSTWADTVLNLLERSIRSVVEDVLQPLPHL